MTYAKARLAGLLPLLVLAAACSDSSSKPQAAASAQSGTPIALQQAPPPADVTPAPSQPDPHAQDMAIIESASPLAKPIDTADWQAEPATPQGRRDALIHAEQPQDGKVLERLRACALQSVHDQQ